MLREHDPHIDARLVDATEDLDNPTHRCTVRRWKARELDDNHVACRGAHQILRGEEDFIEKASIERNDPRPAGIDLETTHERRRPPLQDIDDAPFRPAIPPASVDMDEHPITVKRLAEIASGDIDVSVPAFPRNDEAKPAALDLEPPGDEIHLLGKPNPIRPRARKLPFGDHVFDNALRLDPLLALHAQLFEEVFLGSRPAELPKAFADLLADRVWAECHKGAELKAGPGLCIIVCSTTLVPKWRNGRRAAFRAQFPSGSGGSNPPFGTNYSLLF